jgi:hypothetical protein
MRYLVLVTDYDGTLATDGVADESTLSALERLRMSGRRAILLTGRQLDDLLTVCPRLSLFDYVVAENGAVLYEPRTRQQTLLGPPRRRDFFGGCESLPAIRSALGRLSSIHGYHIILRCFRPFRRWAWIFRSSSTETRSWSYQPA